MSLYKYFKSNDGNCQIRDAVSTTGVIAELTSTERDEVANAIDNIGYREVEKKSGKEKKKTNYGKYDAHKRMEVAKFAMQSSIRPAARKFGINKNTVQGFVDSYKDVVQKTDKEVTLLPYKKRGKPTLLPAEIDRKVMEMASSMRLAGAVVNYNVLIAVAKGIIIANDRTLLAENGSGIKLGWKWCESIFKRMNWTKRKGTTSKSAIAPGLIKELSQIFLTHSGIKQGAPSSVILFLIFMDDFIVGMLEKCADETIIGNLHVLLHADDTVLLSTDREHFIYKCNLLIDMFKEKRMAINIGKSGFMVINTNNGCDRINIRLNNGWLKYCKEYVYLGTIFSDSGTLYTDVDKHTKNKSKSVLIKLANFMRNNESAPITVKCKVLKACLKAAILYGHETWSSSSLQKIETLYRKAIKLTFNISSRAPNDIVYLETGFYELKAEIYNSQYKFWTKIKSDIDRDPDTNVSKLLQLAIQKNVHYLRHYKSLHLNFHNAKACFEHYRENFVANAKQNIRSKATLNEHSIYNEYISLNPTLATPNFYQLYNISEYCRMLITKYRNGSHFLHIHRGRTTGTTKNDRFCKCLDIQTLYHVIFECCYTRAIQLSIYPNITSLELFFQQDLNLMSSALLQIEKKLKLR